ncbi:replication initiation factor domain-containing protein [Photobacterium frigidiphilum]|nr:replication initiation factor domain-containing protein [Photobacterium frigidiphilum]
MTTSPKLHPVLEAKIVVPALASEPVACKKREVACDWLSWSCPISNFKTIHKAGKSGIKVEDNPDFTPMPKPDYKSMSGKSRTAASELYKRQYLLILMARIRQFCTGVLGFDCGPNNGKGKNFYTDSFALITPDGLRAGTVNFGGNNNTVFFELSGVGSSYVFDNNRRRVCDSRYLSPFTLHFWLSVVLDVQVLSRIDLCIDFFDDYLTVDLARKAYIEGAFRRCTGKYPKCSNVYSNSIDGELLGDTFYVGSRQSNVCWRIYDKGLQMESDVNWVRAEVELKKVSVAILLNMSGTFSGLCEFAASLESAKPVKLSIPKNVKKAALTLVQKTNWLRHMCSSSLSALLTHCGGDIGQVMGLILRPTDLDDLVMHEVLDRISVPPSYSNLINFSRG